MKDINDEIMQALSQDEVEFEEMAGIENSPLNQAVAEKKFENTSEPSNREQDASETTDHSESNQETEDGPSFEGPGDDVPAQKINENFREPDEQNDNENFQIPEGHAKQAADTILGMADNFLAVGSGFYVKIKKHKDFYDFEEIVQVIDEQNVKNVRRIRLDEEDKALLRPLLIILLKKKAQKLTPEQQLVGAIISILVKKVQVVMEIKAENDILTERILEIIREGKQNTDKKESNQENPYGAESTAEKEVNSEPAQESYSTSSEDMRVSVLEVAEEDD